MVIASDGIELQVDNSQAILENVIVITQGSNRILVMLLEPIELMLIENFITRADD